jgi:peptidoglycan/LPS O-acetylase OafA/YrhL
MISIFLVIFYHFGFERVNGALGVEIFFVLSGFLITWLLLKESDKTGTVSLISFYKRRAYRIFPEFYAYLIFGLAVQLIRHPEYPVPFGHIISAIFYVGNYYQALKPGDTYLEATWSLAIEEQFYFIWPFVFIRYRNKLKTLAWYTLGIMAAVWLLRIVLYFGFSVNQSYLYHAFETRADHLMAGCLLAIVLKLGAFKSFFDRSLSSPLYPLLTIGIIAASSMFHHNFAYRFGFAYTVESFLIAIAIVQMIYFSDRRGWALIENPAIKYLGKISYSLYLYQTLTLYTARSLTSEYPVIVQLAFAIAVTVGFGSASYYLVGKPFLRLKEKLEIIKT